MTKPVRALVSLSLAAILVACASPTPEPGARSKPEPAAPALITQPAPPIVTPTPRLLSIYHAPEAPEALVAETKNWGIPILTDPGKATLRLELAKVAFPGSVR